MGELPWRRHGGCVCISLMKPGFGPGFFFRDPVVESPLLISMALADVRQDIITRGAPHQPLKQSSPVTRLRPGFFVGGGPRWNANIQGGWIALLPVEAGYGSLMRRT